MAEASHIMTEQEVDKEAVSYNALMRPTPVICLLQIS